MDFSGYIAPIVTIMPKPKLCAIYMLGNDSAEIQSRRTVKIKLKKNIFIFRNLGLLFAYLFQKKKSLYHSTVSEIKIVKVIALAAFSSLRSCAIFPDSCLKGFM